MTPARAFDIAIIGGGFSGIAVFANLVQKAEKSLSIALISRDPLGHFGPAYSTTKPEHLLNVRAGGMGLFVAHPGDFFHWCRDNDIPGTAPAAFMPRMIYARYLQNVLDNAQRLAAEKSIRFSFIQDEVEHITAADIYSIETPNGPIQAKNIVLAIGNSLKASAEKNIPGLISEPWNYDYTQLPKGGHVAIIGSGLTAVDCIISILKSGWNGKISCYSGSGLLPRAHLADFNADKTVKAEPFDAEKTALSQVFSQFLKILRGSTVEWQYAIDGLRPQTQRIWKNLSPRDKRRLAEKYFNRWNVRRHRFAPEIGAVVDTAIANGQLEVLKARCSNAESQNGKVTLCLTNTVGKRRESFDVAFHCTGVNYRYDSNPLLNKLVGTGLLQPDENGYGVAATGDYVAKTDTYGKIYAIGAPLFGKLFETTAVPELRGEADAIATSLLKAL